MIGRLWTPSTLRIVAWNVCMRLDALLDALLELGPDVAVLPESPDEETLRRRLGPRMRAGRAGVAPAVTTVRIGDFESWVGRGLSDHVPLVVEFDASRLPAAVKAA